MVNITANFSCYIKVNKITGSFHTWNNINIGIGCSFCMIFNKISELNSNDLDSTLFIKIIQIGEKFNI